MTMLLETDPSLFMIEQLLQRLLLVHVVNNQTNLMLRLVTNSIM